ncbi:hypothetical protein C8R42DRAFT_724461 [Lentinula raphanica]|nr:hypothetical protein C8R42DRAFT_724461 [Lentinula raphanica]
MSFEKPVPFRDRFDYNLPQRRIAHISSIQIRNLTPFPARDTLTSALSKPTEFSNLTNGHAADDLDTIPTRKCTRRISTASVVTVRTSRSEDGEFNGVPDIHEGRKRASSRFSEKEKEKSATVGRSAPTLRPQRNRTTSLASIFTPPTHLSEASNLEPPYKTPSLLEDDYSQTGLENIISSRLVQTFLAVTALPEPHPVQDDATASSSFSPPASPPNGFPVLGPRKDVSSPSPFSKSRRDSSTSTRSSSHSPPAIWQSARVILRLNLNLVAQPVCSELSVLDTPTIPHSFLFFSLLGGIRDEILIRRDNFKTITFLSEQPVPNASNSMLTSTPASESTRSCTVEERHVEPAREEAAEAKEEGEEGEGDTSLYKIDFSNVRQFMGLGLGSGPNVCSRSVS